MKKITILLILFSFNFILSQGFKEQGNSLIFSEVIEVTGKTKSDIYKGIKLFLNDTNQKSKYFIDMDDPANGIISYTAETPYFELSYDYIFKSSYKATIEIKDGKFRYSIPNIEFFKNMTKLNMDLRTDYQSILEEAGSSKEFERLNNELSKAKKEKRKQELLDTISKRQKYVEGVKKDIEKTKEIISSQPILIKDYILKNENW